MISATTEHAVRALIQLALLGRGGIVTGKQLSKTAGIPRNYLATILWSLGRAGIIQATRGTGGGYRLRRDAGQIRLTEVVDLFEHQRWRKGCFLNGGQQCKEAHPCTAHTAWVECREVLDRFLDRTTIAALAVSAQGPPSKPPKVKRRRTS
jgi:Rrf2 family protein